MTPRPLIAAALVAMALSAPALAADERLAAHFYRADEVVRVEGRPGIQATIMFADDEHVENIAVGDSSTWQITPNKRANLLFLKPLSRRAHTNMTVVTDQRTYFFDLAVAEGRPPLYSLRFTYPEKPKPQRVVQQPARMGVPNFAWKVGGKGKLAPDRVFDDGESTWLSWAEGRPLPAILVRDQNGNEGPVNYAVRENYIVLDRVPSSIILRSGKDSTILVRGKPTPAATAAAPAAPADAATPTALGAAPLAANSPSR
ncbi:MAG TPA: TrbG/VirB9 family P-type conjugative transfer protein [Novosphingobium sp.]|nr:TrbG/VirB9 family P-type conjugative transfer protein [Novosphingobium sp.]